MKRRILLAMALAGFVGMAAQADLTVGVDSNAAWIGYMNVSDLPQNGGAYQFGSSWGTADLTAVFSGSTLTLGPNTIGDPAAYWYTPSGGPGSVGNKIMDASMYVEYGALPGQKLTFSGNVLSDTLTLLNNSSNYDANTNGWTAVAFVKDFASDYSSFNVSTVPLAPGAFSVSLDTVNDPTRHVQYGFEVIGPDVWATDVGPYGTVQIQAIPEPATIGLIGIFGAGLLVFRRKFKI